MIKLLNLQLFVISLKLKACDTWEKKYVHVKNFVQFLHVYIQKTYKFVFKIAEVGRLLLVLTMKIIFPINFAGIEFFYILLNHK